MTLPVESRLRAERDALLAIGHPPVVFHVTEEEWWALVRSSPFAPAPNIPIRFRYFGIPVTGVRRDGSTFQEQVNLPGGPHEVLGKKPCGCLFNMVNNAPRMLCMEHTLRSQFGG